MSTEPEFRKSSFCGNGACVEVAFRRSSFCSNGACVEVARAGAVLVRDGKDPDGAVLTFESAAWDAFVRGIQAGEFDA